jgi:hypothetical protein
MLEKGKPLPLQNYHDVFNASPTAKPILKAISPTEPGGIATALLRGCAYAVNRNRDPRVVVCLPKG